MKGVFAPVGSFIPGTGITLKAAAIRGVESAGMLLSEREMELSDEHAGIIELPADAPVGAPAAEALGLDDPVIDVAITPNRGDCLGVRGIARDLAAAGLGALKPLDTAPVPGRFASPIGVRLDFAPDAAAACPYFAGRLIRGVRNGESPRWLQDRLLAVGLRPISALVDITNYLTLDLCRPLHVFDADKLAGGLHVRLARDGERLAALNGKDYELDAGDDGDRRRRRRAGARRRHRRRAHRLHRDDDRRVPRSGAVRSDAHRRHRPRAEHQLRRPLPLRARHRSDVRSTWGLEVATRLILELCGGEPSRRGGRRRAAAAAPADRLPARRGCARWPASTRRPRRVRRACSPALGFDAATFAGETPGRSQPPSWRNDIEGEAVPGRGGGAPAGLRPHPRRAAAAPASLPQPALYAGAAPARPRPPARWPRAG